MRDSDAQILSSAMISWSYGLPMHGDMFESESIDCKSKPYK